LLTRPAVASVILGVRTMAQLEDNLAAADLALSAEQIASLDRVSAPPEGYPYRYLRIYGTRLEFPSD
jgi:aryl-alcohol dehydrogenase-like predicted oxidoreductase